MAVVLAVAIADPLVCRRNEGLNVVLGGISLGSIQRE